MIGLVRLAMLFLLLQAGPPSPPAGGGASIRGRVTDAESSQPLRHALVALRAADLRAEWHTIAGTDGTYAFHGLRAGSYFVQASAGEHLGTHIPRGYSTSPSSTSSFATTSIQLKDGQTRTDIDIALQRSRAINGRVVDEDGGPIAGASLRLLRAPGGQPFSPAVTARTDDLGSFRIFYVPPGQYFVCAEVPPSARFRDHIDNARPRRMITTCHPSATGESLGQAVSVTAADVDGVEIRAPLHPGITISGQVLDASGTPAGGAQVWLSQSWRGRGGGVGSPPLPEDGVFRISDVPLGKYLLRAHTGEAGPKRLPDFQWVAMELEVGAADIEGLVLTLSPAARVKGRIVFEDGAPETRTPLQVRADPVGSLAGFRQFPASLDAENRFELTGLAGPQTIAVSPMPPRWVLKSIRYRGGDITNLETEFRTGPDEIEIVLTSRIAVVSGRVLDRDGGPVTAGRVLIATADPAKWSGQGLRSSVALRRDGSFTLAPQLAGEYLVFALSPEDYEALGTAPQYTLVESLAQRVTLQEHERRSIDIRLSTLAPVR